MTLVVVYILMIGMSLRGSGHVSFAWIGTIICIVGTQLLTAENPQTLSGEARIVAIITIFISFLFSIMILDEKDILEEKDTKMKRQSSENTSSISTNTENK